MSLTRRQWLRGAVGLLVVAAMPLPALLQQEVARHGGVSLDELNAITLRYIVPALSDSYFEVSPFLAFIKSRSVVSFAASAPIQCPVVYGPV